jgi:hypothetical protein
MNLLQDALDRAAKEIATLREFEASRDESKLTSPYDPIMEGVGDVLDQWMYLLNR